MKKNQIIIITLVTILIFIVSALPIPKTLSHDLININQDMKIPKLYFEGEITDLKNKKTERKITVKYESDAKKFESYASIKLQGTSSLMYEKKNYNIKLYKDEKLEEKLNVDLGWGGQNKYCLKANWVDKTHSRNVVTAKIVSKINKKYNLFETAPNYGEIDGYPVEIYLNNEFLGLYTLNIPKDDWMFNMDDENPNHIVVASEGWNDSNLFKEEANWKDWSIEVGEDNDETLDKLNILFDFIINSSDEEFKQNINKYINLDSIINYYIMMNYAQLEDNAAKNMLLSTYDGKLWYMSLYDLDTSWGTTWNGKNLVNYKKNNITADNYIFTRIEKLYPNEIAERYFELRKTILTKENIMNEFATFINSIPKDTYKKEAERWKNIPGYNINQINDFLEVKIPFLDEKFTEMYTKPQIVKIDYKKNKNNTITAQIKTNRNDVILPEKDTYTFTHNGEYIFYYEDFMGYQRYIKAKTSDLEPKQSLKR